MPVADKLWNEVDEHIGRLVEQDNALLAALKESADAGLPPSHVSPPQGKLLMLLAQVQRARSILEIGPLGGYARSGSREVSVRMAVC